MKEFVFLCDRCGQYYTDYCPNSHKYYVGTTLTTKLDLCMYCHRALESFMSNNKEDKHEK